MRDISDWIELNRRFQRVKEKRSNEDRTSETTEAEYSDTILTEALMTLLNVSESHVLKAIVLTFLQENCIKLFRRSEHLVKFMRTAEHLLKRRPTGSERKGLQLIQGQLLITWTSLLIDLDAIRKHSRYFEGFVNILCRILFAQDTVSSNLRLMACVSLKEIEITYPCLLEHLLGDLLESMRTGKNDRLGMHRSSTDTAASSPRRHARSSCQLLELSQRETSHGAQAYISLMLTILEHVSTRSAREAAAASMPPKRPITDGDASSPDASDPSSSHYASFETPPASVRARRLHPAPISKLGRSIAARKRTEEHGRGSARRDRYYFAVNAWTRSNTNSSLVSDAARYQKHFHLSHVLYGAKTPCDVNAIEPFPAVVASCVLPALSVAFESLTHMSTWQRASAISRLSVLATTFGLHSGAVQHHLLPLLQMRNPLICHVLMLVHAGHPGLFTERQRRSIVVRICHLIRDHTAILQLRILAVQWVVDFPSHDRTRSFALLREHADDLYPEPGDPLDLRAAKLRALLRCFDPLSKDSKTPILRALCCVREWPYFRDDSRFCDVANRFLLGALQRFPKLCPRITRLLVRVTCTWPHLVDNTVRFVDAYASSKAGKSPRGRATTVYVWQRLAAALPTLVPTIRLCRYFALMNRIARESSVDPTPLVRALLHLVADSKGICARGPWRLGMRLLKVCKIIMASHPPSMILASLDRLLYFVEVHYGDVDVRDSAHFYRNVLLHVHDPKLSRILGVDGDSAGKANTSVSTREASSPRAAFVRSVNVASILELRRSLSERQTIGIFDGGSADISLSAKAIDSTRPSMRKKKMTTKAKSALDFDEEDATRFLQQYLENIDDNEGGSSSSNLVPRVIHLPFHLTIRADVAAGKPHRFYALVMDFSPSPDYLPVKPISLPYVSSVTERSSNAVDAAESIVRFPKGYKIVLSLTPIAPCPATFSVRVVFTNADGRCSEGQLQQLSVCFQDLFLPLPVAAIAYDGVDDSNDLASRTVRITEALFRPLWQRLDDDRGDEILATTTATTTKGGRRRRRRRVGTSAVKLLHLGREAVHRCLKKRLGPFSIASTESSDLDELSRRDAEEPWYAKEIASAFGSRSSSTCADGHKTHNSTPKRPSRVAADVRRVAIFLPPAYHLLMMFYISENSTIVRVRTDYWQVLSELDEYFSSWK